MMKEKLCNNSTACVYMAKIFCACDRQCKLQNVTFLSNFLVMKQNYLPFAFAAVEPSGTLSNDGKVTCRNISK